MSENLMNLAWLSAFNLSPMTEEEAEYLLAIHIRIVCTGNEFSHPLCRLCFFHTWGSNLNLYYFIFPIGNLITWNVGVGHPSDSNIGQTED